jgi:16S rRNA A1518/A1519 N6-dimethyltransferase RsmA/KsgA/DIM1 with predicted DNA glycosylase/AP lyase activity
MEQKRDYTKFYTPENIANAMAELAELKNGMKVLEPSAGSGRLVTAIKTINPSVFVHAVELYTDVVISHLLHSTADMVTNGDFLKLPLSSESYDRVIANPPFGNDTPLLSHFTKMYNTVKSGGIIICITPFDFEISKIFKGEWGKVPIDNWSSNSDGTTTQICMIKFIKR